MVRTASRSWTAPDGFSGPVEGLDEPGYDLALDAAGPYLAASFGDDLVDFVSDLKLESMRVVRDEPRGTVLASLFALPVEGEAAAIEALANDPDTLGALAESLLREGVAAQGSRVAFLRGALTPERMLLALPGRIRRCLALALDAGGTNVLGAEASAAILAHLSEPPPGRAEVPDEVGGLSARVLLGIRVLAADADGEVPVDYFSCFMPEAVVRDVLAMAGEGPVLSLVGDDDEGGEGGGDLPDPVAEAPELDLWLAEANAAVAPLGLTFALPDHWARATAVMACMHLQRRFAVALAAAGGIRGGIEQIHVHRGDRAIALGATVDGRLVGPVSVPRCLISADPAQLDLALQAYEAPVSYHEENDPFPALAAA